MKNKTIAVKFETILQRHLNGFNEAKRLQQLAFSTAREATAQAKLCGYDHYMQGYSYNQKQNDSQLLKSAWRSIIKTTKLSVLMDSKATKEMEDQLKSSPPEFTEENIRSVLYDLLERKDEIMADSLLNTFYSLSKKYCSNQDFKLTSKRLIVHIGTTRNNSYSDRLTDLDRVFHYMDGKPFDAENRYETLGYRANQGEESLIETEYFKIKIFFNGNAHINFLRDDLVTQCNKLIAYHNRNALGFDFNRTIKNR